MTEGGPSTQTVAIFETRLERQRRLAALRLDALVMSITDMGDLDGWARLNALGTRSITEVQADAIATVDAYLIGTLADNRIPGDGVVVPIRPGLLHSGQSVARFIFATRDAVGARMNAGDTFPLALEASKNVVVAVGASEPHRIGRDGTYEAAREDPRYTRYRRVAEPKACKFCMMLASRGAVYLSESSAGAAKRFHSHCRCHVEAVTSAAARKSSRESGAKDWAAMNRPGKGTQLQPIDRVASVRRQLEVLRRQVDDGTATQWTRDRIGVLEAEAA